MAENTPGTAVPEAEIDWLPGSEPDLSDRELTLVRNAHAEGYARGEQHAYDRGYQQGMRDAVEAMTTITTRVSTREVLEAIKTLNALTHAEVAV